MPRRQNKLAVPPRLAPAEAETGVRLTSLPPELLVRIIAGCDPRSICRVERTARQFAYPLPDRGCSLVAEALSSVVRATGRKPISLAQSLHKQLKLLDPEWRAAEHRAHPSIEVRTLEVGGEVTVFKTRETDTFEKM
jgi:hypothetical protein|uniref:F-box domain-containing protein n=1 Tax=Haptolina ericina TaxID=156174 RepID=A0A7S3FAB9_9EUKA|mmetsp:Transcript_60944/g.135795  ORF Transcript_60944/g.135795 Transcript_60944/m.135795 type:complete len:137 (+) Transcript_60944:52-462(+)